MTTWFINAGRLTKVRGYEGIFNYYEASYVLTGSKPFGSHAIAFISERRTEKFLKNYSMETASEKSKTGKTGRSSKGGRPKKREHLDQKITVMCSRFVLCQRT